MPHLSIGHCSPCRTALFRQLLGGGGGGGGVGDREVACTFSAYTLLTVLGKVMRVLGAFNQFEILPETALVPLKSFPAGKISFIRPSLAELIKNLES